MGVVAKTSNVVIARVVEIATIERE